MKRRHNRLRMAIYYSVITLLVVATVLLAVSIAAYGTDGVLGILKIVGISLTGAGIVVLIGFTVVSDVAVTLHKMKSKYHFVKEEDVISKKVTLKHGDVLTVKVWGIECELMVDSERYKLQNFYNDSENSELSQVESEAVINFLKTRPYAPEITKTTAKHYLSKLSGSYTKIKSPLPPEIKLNQIAIVIADDGAPTLALCGECKRDKNGISLVFAEDRLGGNGKIVFIGIGDYVSFIDAENLYKPVLI